MVTPDKVVDKIIEILEANKASINADLVIGEMAEDNARDFTPPYFGVYWDMEDESDLNSAGNIASHPVPIYIQVCSTEKQDASESMKEALQYSFKAIKILKDFYHNLDEFESGTEGVSLYLQKTPFSILQKTAKGSIIQLNYEYLLKGI